MKWIAVMALVFIAGIIVGAIRPYAPKPEIGRAHV